MKYVYTDGACSNNGHHNASAGLGIYFGKNDKRNTSKKIIGKQTNNIAELNAVKEAINLIQNSDNYTIFTDSEYVIKCCTNYGEKQHKQNWTKNIPNKNLVKELYTLYNSYDNIKLDYIKAHTGKNDIHSIGNEMADKLARQAVGKSDENRIYLNVAYENKDLAKHLGCRWDKSKKKWYTFSNNNKNDTINKLFS